MSSFEPGLLKLRRSLQQTAEYLCAAPKRLNSRQRRAVDLLNQAYSEAEVLFSGQTTVSRAQPLLPPLHPFSPSWTITKKPEETLGEVTLGPLYAGPEGVVHGGFVALLVDQLMVVHGHRWLPEARTHALQLDYLKPVPINRRLTVTVRHEMQSRRTMGLALAISLSGQLLLRAEGRLVQPHAAAIE